MILMLQFNDYCFDLDLFDDCCLVFSCVLRLGVCVSVGVGIRLCCYLLVTLGWGLLYGQTVLIITWQVFWTCSWGFVAVCICFLYRFVQQLRLFLFVLVDYVIDFFALVGVLFDIMTPSFDYYFVLCVCAALLHQCLVMFSFTWVG